MRFRVYSFKAQASPCLKNICFWQKKKRNATYEVDKKWVAVKVQVMARLNEEKIWRLRKTKKQMILGIGFQRIFGNFRESGNEDENRVLGN